MTFSKFCIYICFAALFNTLSYSQINAQDKNDLLNTAYKTLSKGDTSLAILQLRFTLTEYPQSYMAAGYLSEIAYEQHQFTQAIAYCNVALDIIDNKIEAIQQDSIKEMSLQIASPADQLPVYRIAKSNMHHLKGKIRLEQQNRGEAISEFKKSLEVSTSATVLTSLALVYLEIGYSYDAIKLLHQATEFTPDDDNLYLNLGNVFNKLDRADSALYYYNKATTVNPNSKWPYLYAGIINTRQKAYDSALTDYNHFISLDSSNAEVYFRRAVLFSEQRHWESAIKDWDKVTQLTPKSADAWRNKGLSYFQQGNYEAAINCFDKAIEFGREQAYTYINRGYSYYLLNKPEKALEDINQGLKDLPRYELGFYFRALTHLQLKNKQQACEDANLAISLGMKKEEMDKRLLKKCF